MVSIVQSIIFSKKIRKIKTFLKKPLPEILFHLESKFVTYFYKIRLLQCGSKIFISKGTRILGASNMVFGNSFYCGQLCWFEAIESYKGIKYNPSIVFGNNVSLSQNVHIASIAKVTISDNVLVGSNVYISDHQHGSYLGNSFDDPPRIYPSNRQLSTKGPVQIGPNVWIGDNVTILSGVEIGCGSIIGSNSVVVSNIPPYVIAVGCPAVAIKRFSFNDGIWIRL